MFAGPVSGLPTGDGRAGSDTDHSRTVLSALPAASSWPDGLNATDSTYPAGPCSVACSTGASGLATFHSRTVPSALPAASRRPSGLNATEYTVPAGPVSGWPAATGWAGSAMFHSRTRRSAPAAATATNSLASGLSEVRLPTSAAQSRAIASCAPRGRAEPSRPVSSHILAASVIRRLVRRSSRPASIQDRSRGQAVSSASWAICALSASTVIRRSSTNRPSRPTALALQLSSSASQTTLRVGGASSATCTSRRNSRRAISCSSAESQVKTPSAVRVMASEIPPLAR